jgi:hypothetical protein
MVTDLFDMVGLHWKRRGDRKINKVRGERRVIHKSEAVRSTINKSELLLGKYSSVDELPSKVKIALLETIEEYKRRGRFIRLYPSHCTPQYDHFFATTRSINVLVHQILFMSKSLPKSIVPVTNKIKKFKDNYREFKHKSQKTKIASNKLTTNELIDNNK